MNEEEIFNATEQMDDLFEEIGMADVADPADHPKGQSLYDITYALAKACNEDGQYMLGYLLQTRLARNMPEPEKRKRTRRAAELGNSVALYELGVNHWDSGDPENATVCFCKADIPPAFFALGKIFLEGDGDEAAYWFRKAAEEGDMPEAYFELASIYHQGRGVVRDYGKAALWMQIAATFEYAPALHALGMFAYNGIGVPADYERAIDCLTDAAEQGYAPAQFDLAGLFEEDGDMGQALSLYQAAAAQGFPLALEVLADMAG